MQVREIMTADLHTVGPYTPFRDIVATLIDHDISAVPVVEGERLVGLVSEADLLSKEAFPLRRTRRILHLLGDVLAGGDTRWLTRAAGQTARELMTVDLLTVDPATEVTDAARPMLERNVSQLLVVQDGVLVGIVSRRDLLRAFVRSDHALLLELNDRLGSLALQLEHDVHATVDDGVVTLVGDVARDDDVDAIVGAVRTTEGITDLRTRISVRTHR
jgi:CBS domain-containing protein